MNQRLMLTAALLQRDVSAALQEATKNTVDVLMDAAFSAFTFRDPRSNEYKAGVRAILEFKINGKPLNCPWRVGTAQADAWFSGLDEGHRIARSR